MPFSKVSRVLMLSSDLDFIEDIENSLSSFDISYIESLSLFSFRKHCICSLDDIDLIFLDLDTEDSLHPLSTYFVVRNILPDTCLMAFSNNISNSLTAIISEEPNSILLLKNKLMDYNTLAKMFLKLKLSVVGLL